MPRWLASWRVGLDAVFRRRRLEDQMAAELRFHLERQVEENRSRARTWRTSW